MANKPILDQIALRGGESLNALVLDKQFILTTRYGKLTLKKSDIFSIEFAAASSGKDSVRTSEGTVLEGALAPAQISVRTNLGGGAELKIPKSDIFVIVMLSQRGGSLSAKTSNTLSKLRTK